MSLLILAVGWAYTQICRIYPDGGGVYTAAKHKSRTAGRRRRTPAVRRLHGDRQPECARRIPLLRLPLQKHAQVAESNTAANTGDQAKIQDAGDSIITESDSAHTVDLPALPPGVSISTDIKNVHYECGQETPARGRHVDS